MTSPDAAAINSARLTPGDDVANGDLNAAARRHLTVVRRCWAAVTVVVMLLALRTFVAEPVRVDSASMAPTLLDDEWLLIDKITRHWRPFERGDIITARDPQTSGWIIKRIVGLGGDTVALDDGHLIVRGRPVDEPYADQSGMDGRYYGPVVVPPGHVFLLGDNRDESADSRTFGPVPVEDITGRLIGHL
jgi:signal peptidase I